MPLELPSHANLEHLKKQAKALLYDFQSGDAQAIEKFSSLSLQEAPILADAQHILARDYGFSNWTALKKHVDSLAVENADPFELAKNAFHSDDAPAMRLLLDRYPQLREKINDPLSHFNSPAITLVRSRAMLDVLLDAGADINVKSHWWAGGFSLLENASPELAAYAITRGAQVTVHAAARLGLFDQLQNLVAENPSLVHAPGGDGQTPLHFASTVEIAAFLLDHGAVIDALDVDHESTPAQYMIESRQEIARYLIQRGCKTDILMAAALGDAKLASAHLDANPDVIRIRVSDEFFPLVGNDKGGTIYQWQLGWYVSAPQVARKFGHHELCDLLLDRCPPDEKLLNACWFADESAVNDLLTANSNLVPTLTALGRRQLAHAARNNDSAACRLMLQAGLPIDSFSQHHAMPLHWAAFHGNLEIARAILDRHPDIENIDNEYKSTPLGWAIFGSENGWFGKTGNYEATVETLLDAGAKLPDKLGGTRAVRQILRRHDVAE
jgi:ankyrin repeat protein